MYCFSGTLLASLTKRQTDIINLSYMYISIFGLTCFGLVEYYALLLQSVKLIIIREHDSDSLFKDKPVFFFFFFFWEGGGGGAFKGLKPL